MHFLELTLPSLAENLALDEALLLSAETGGPPVLRVWQWPQYAVVLGAGGLLGEDVDESACRADRVAVTRRSSGGGTVLLGPGCLLFSLILSRAAALMDVKASYRHILGETAAALAGLVPDIALAGTSDLASAGRKFSGNAQQRKRTHILHHGTLLFAFDLSKIARYLKPPCRQPEYRQQRDHEAFVMNLPTDAAELTRRLRERWQALERLTHWPQEKIHALVQEKYGTEGWTRRR